VTTTRSLPVDSPVARDADGDETLARRVATGDRGAFERLMRLHNRQLFRLARATLRDDADAEDALQEAYVRAYRTIDGFRAEAALSTWLSRIVLNECLGRLRRKLRREQIVPMLAWTGDVEVEAAAIPDGSAPDKELMQRQMRAVLEAALDGLPIALRTVFVLRCIEDQTVEQTAACLQIPEATVRSRTFRARSLLREALAAQIDTAEREVFGFAGVRCDRIVAAVLARLDGAAAPDA
jgi:RNA polymerase sigma-70 factor (ECF subfamily)